MPLTKLALSALQDQAVVALQGVVAEAENKTELLREVAGLYVDARAILYSPTGDPDWLGRSADYRRWVRETMTRAQVEEASQSNLQAALRYHIGNILRERLDTDTLDDLGLRHESPRERSVEKREHTSTVLSYFAGGAPIDSAEDLCFLGELMLSALRRVNANAVAKLPKKKRQDVREAFAEVATIAATLAK